MDERTHSKSDTENLPVPVAPALPEAYQRAPTLMAGDAPGEQGAVHVWAPEPAAIRQSAWGRKKHPHLHPARHRVGELAAYFIWLAGRFPGRVLVCPLCFYQSNPPALLSHHR